MNSQNVFLMFDCYMLRPLEDRVACCWELLWAGQLKRVILSANNLQNLFSSLIIEAYQSMNLRKAFDFPSYLGGIIWVFHQKAEISF